MGNDECHLPLLEVAAATDQSKLPKDDGGQSLCKVVGHKGPDQLNYDNRCLQMGGGTTRTSLQSQKTTHISGDGIGMTINSDCNATQ